MRKSPSDRVRSFWFCAAKSALEPHLLGGGGKVVVPQQCQLFVNRLMDGYHAAQPPVRQFGQLFVDPLDELFADGHDGALVRGRAGRAASASVSPPRPDPRRGWRSERRQRISTNFLAATASTCAPVVPNPARRSTRAVVIHPSDWPAITQLCLTFLRFACGPAHKSISLFAVNSGCGVAARL